MHGAFPGAAFAPDFRFAGKVKIGRIDSLSRSTVAHRQDNSSRRRSSHLSLYGLFRANTAAGGEYLREGLLRTHGNLKITSIYCVS